LSLTVASRQVRRLSRLRERLSELAAAFESTNGHSPN
jgi:hypothetical protein